MGHAVASLCQSGSQFDDGVSDDEVFSLDGDGQGEDEDALLGQQIAESEQDAVDRTGSADDAHVEGQSREQHLARLCQLLSEGRAESAYHIKDKELLGPQNLLQHASEHPQGEHIEEDVFQAAVHEHVGEWLPEVESWREPYMQTQNVVQVEVVLAPHHHRQIAQNVDDEKVFGNRR